MAAPVERPIGRPSSPVETDGRRARAERNRDAVVEAILDLLCEGVQHPTAEAIAERSGVSVRSVFRHFDDLESLHAAAVDRHSERIRDLFVPPPSTGSLASRIDGLAARRSSAVRSDDACSSRRRTFAWTQRGDRRTTRVRARAPARLRSRHCSSPSCRPRRGRLVVICSTPSRPRPVGATGTCCAPSRAARSPAPVPS